MSTFIGMGATNKVASKTNNKELKELKSKIEELENNGTKGEKETPEDDKKSKNKNE